MVLKHSIATNVTMIIGGLLLSFLFFRSVFGFGEFNDLDEPHSKIFLVLGSVGLLMFLVGAVTLVRRSRSAITIDTAGIRLPVRNVFSSRVVFIAREDIVTVSKHESIRGRLIVISTISGERVIVRARFYCELDEFLFHCKWHGIPVS